MTSDSRLAPREASDADERRPRCRFPGCEREPVPPTGDGGRLPVYCDDPAHNARSAYRKRQAEKRASEELDDDTGAAPEHEDNGRRRSEILHLAAVEFSRRGFHATTIRDLSKAVGFTQPMLYYYVGSKDAFLLAICEELLDAHLSAVAHLERSARPAPERLAEFVELELTLAEEHAPEVTVYLRERQTLPVAAKRRLRTRQEALERVLRAILLAGAETGELSLISIETAAAAIWAVLNSSLSGRRPELPAATLAKELSTMMLRGLLPR